ncbi:MAG: TraB domain-containing protein [Nanoarchaeota archaeon]
MTITIIGTSHIARTSIRDIKHAYDSLQPDIIAVELDYSRMVGLLSKTKDSLPLSIIKRIGVSGYLFALIGRALQKRLGDIVHMTPGSDMKYAIKIAQHNKKTLALIDRDIIITLQRFSQAFTTKEKFRLAKDIILAPFSKRIRLDLRQVPPEELIETLLLELKKRYPGIYLALIHERNVHMAKQLSHLHNQHPDARILAVVGAGHKKGMERLLSETFKKPQG